MNKIYGFFSSRIDFSKILVILEYLYFFILFLKCVILSNMFFLVIICFFFSNLYDKSVRKFARSICNSKFIEYFLSIPAVSSILLFFRINAVMFVPIFLSAVNFFSPAALI